MRGYFPKMKKKFAIFFYLPFLLLHEFPGNADAAEIHGRVALEGDGSPGGTAVRIFDGFEWFSLETDKEGTFHLKTNRVTPGESMILYVTRPEYRPEAVRFHGGDIDSNFSVGLKRMADPEEGFVFGSLFVPVSGGKRKFIFGIHHLVPDRGVLVKNGEKRWEVRSDTEGRFLFSVPPGRYHLSVEGDPREYPVEVMSGETSLQNIAVGRMMAD